MKSGKLLVEGRRPRTCCGICIQCPAFSCFWYLVHEIELTLCCFQCRPTKICSQSELFISLLSKWATFHSVPSDTFLFELTLMGKYEKDSICWIIKSLKMNPFYLIKVAERHEINHPQNHGNYWTISIDWFFHWGGSPMAKFLRSTFPIKLQIGVVILSQFSLALFLLINSSLWSPSMPNLFSSFNI